MARTARALDLGIELGRVGALFAVITLHSTSLGLFAAWPILGYLADTASRFAVPMFFLISGWFWKDSQLQDPCAASWRLAQRVGVPYAFWVVVYTALEVTAAVYPPSTVTGLKYYILLPISGGAGFHLWFLPALLIGTVVSWFALHSIGKSLTLAAAGALYVLGVVAWFYFAVFRPEVNPILYRNGLLFAPLFLVAGHLLRDHMLSWKLSMVLVLLGMSLHGVEGSIAGDFPAGHDLSFGTIPFAIGMFSLFVQSRGRPHSVALLGKYTFGRYLLHLLFLKVVSHQFEPQTLGTIGLCIVATFVLSLAVSGLLNTMPFVRRVV